MRLPYVPNPPPATLPAEDAAVVARIAARRAPRPLQPLDLALLHAPPVADGWNSFLGAVRTRTTLPADARELAIARVAVVNRAWYEWGHHAPLALQAGVPQAAVDLVKTERGALTLAARPGGDDKDRLFSEAQWASVVLADEMTRNVEVADETFAKVKALFGERGTIELVATVSCYNCVSRFLVALDGELICLEYCRRGTTPFLIVATCTFFSSASVANQFIVRCSRREKRHGSGCSALSASRGIHTAKRTAIVSKMAESMQLRQSGITE